MKGPTMAAILQPLGYWLALAAILVAIVRAWARLGSWARGFLVGGVGVLLGGSVVCQILFRLRPGGYNETRMAVMQGVSVLTTWVGWGLFAIGVWRLIEDHTTPGAAPTAPPAQAGAATGTGTPHTPGRRLAMLSLALFVAAVVVGGVAIVLAALSLRPGGFLFTVDDATAIAAGIVALLAETLALASAVTGLVAVRARRYVLWWVIPVLLVQLGLLLAVAAGMMGGLAG